MSQGLFNFVAPDVSAVLNTVATVVGSTLGQNGSSVVVGNGEKTYTTKDGVSVLRFINSNDPFIQNVINVIRESSENTLREAGDGTTSTILLANAMLIALKQNAFTQEELKEKVKKMISKLKSLSIPLTDRNVRKLIETAIGNEPELSELVYKAHKESEKHNVPITVEPTIGYEHRMETIDGISFRAKIVSELFKGKEVIAEKPHVICYAGNIESEKEVVKAIDKCLSLGIKNVVVIANGYSEEALAIMSINQLQGNINIIPLMVSGGDMHDTEIINIIAKALDSEIGGESFSTRLYDSFTKIYDKADTFKMDKDMAIFEGINATNDLSKEVSKYMSDLESIKDDDEMNKIMFIVSILKRKIVKLIVSAAIENKLNELKDRVDDSLHSLLTAKNTGVVKGSGFAYIELNSQTVNAARFQKCFETINTALKKQSGGFDSAKTIEAVLVSSSQLALLLNNVSYVLNVPKK